MGRITAVTVICAVPDLPPLVAVMVTGPALTPVTTPAAETVAKLMSLELHVIDGFETTTPLMSVTVAVATVVAPTGTEAAALTVTVLTGTGFTVITLMPVTPPLAAVIVADPTATPVTT